MIGSPLQVAYRMESDSHVGISLTRAHSAPNAKNAERAQGRVPCAASLGLDYNTFMTTRTTSTTTISPVNPLGP
jgi:hypothetical protein